MAPVLAPAPPAERAPAAPAARPTTGPPTVAPAGELSGTLAEALVLVVAPSTGRFLPATAVGADVDAGTVVGHVTGGRGRADAATVPVGGRLRALLVAPGRLVRRGQALAWLERGATA